MRSSSATVAAARALFVFALLLLASSASAQSYVPLVYPQSTCSSATARLVSVGNSSQQLQYGSVATTSLSGYGSVYLTAFNNSGLFGAVLQQVTLPLGDNSLMSGPYTLRIGVYQLGAAIDSYNDWGLSLLAQTDSVTVYPSAPQVLYANLLQPVQLLSGSQYAIGVWTNGGPPCASSNQQCSVSVYGQPGATSYSGYANGYNDYTLPATLTGYGPSTYNALAIGVTGCLDSAPLASGTAVYFMCAFTQDYAPASSTTNYQLPSTTTTTTVSGVLTVSTATSSTSFGTASSVLSFSGTVATELSGQEMYSYPEFVTNSIAVVQSNSSSSLAGVTPSQVVYVSGPAASVDASGLSLTASNGVQYVLQWNAAAKQYQLLSSSNGGAVPTILYSRVTLTPVTAAADPSFVCTPTQLQATTPTPVPSCPAGSLSVYAGDFSEGQLNGYGLSAGQSGGQISTGNQLYFRPFLVSVAGTTVASLTTYLSANPGLVVHLRMGLYALNGSINTPAWSLLALTAEQVIPNPAGGVVEVGLPSAQALPLGTYAIGVWFDQPVYTANLYWSGAPPSPSSLLLPYTYATASGQMPAYVQPTVAYEWQASGARTCVPSAQPLIQFSFCAAYPGPYGSVDYTGGVLTALPTLYSNSFGSYYLVTGGNATRNGNIYSLQPASTTAPVQQRLYIASSTAGNVSLDTTGLSLVYWQSYELYQLLLSAKPVPNTPAWQYGATVYYSYGSEGAVNVGAGEFSYAPYTAGSSVPDCAYIQPSYANVLSPPSQQTTTCSSVVGQLPVTLGDTVFADYANQAEGTGAPALTVYTNPFTVATSGFTVSQVTVDILANTLSTLGVYMGIYSAAGTLMASTDLLQWAQAYDQQVTANLLTPALLPAGSYYAAIVANGSLNIATATTQSPKFTVASLALPATATLTGATASAGAVPLFVTGCTAATLSFCAQVQYSTPAALTGLGYPLSTTFQYQGLLAGVTNSDQSVTVQSAVVHASGQQRTAYSMTSLPSAYAVLSLLAPSKVYPNQAQALDATGLILNSANLSLNVNLSYSAAQGQYVDTWGAAIYPGSTIVTSTFVVAPIGASGTAIPACSITALTSTAVQAVAPPTCSSGSGVVTLGDSNGADFTYNTQQINYENNYELFTTVQLSSGNTSVQLSQVALAILQNNNVVARMRFGVYSAQQQLLGTTNELLLANPQAGVVTGTLSSPVLVAPYTSYYLAVWADNALFMAWTPTYTNWCAQITYSSSASLPANFSAQDYNNGVYWEQYCTPIPLSATGCSVPNSAVAASSSTGAIGPSQPTSAPLAATSSSTGVAVIAVPSSTSAGSNDVSLSKGAVAGIVIGCVVGTNLLLLACLFCLFGLGRRGSAGTGTGSVQKGKQTHSEMDPHSRVELATAEQSKIDHE